MKKILSLAGDGIGQEVVPVSIKVLKAVTSLAGRDIEIVHGLVGGDAIDEVGSPLPDETLSLARESDAILLGGVGGPKWDHLPTQERPERGLLGLRQSLGLYANLRPALVSPALVDSSSLVRRGAPARQPFASSDSARLNSWRAEAATLPSNPVHSTGG